MSTSSKKFQCVKLDKTEEVGKTIEQWQAAGWHLRTYVPVVGQGTLGFQWVYHFLLFESN